MAEHELSGFDGNVAIGTGVAVGLAVTKWAAVHAIDQVKVPPAFGSKYRKTKAGPGEITGSLEGNLVAGASGNKPFDPSGTDFSSFIGVLTLTGESGCTIVGTFLFHNVAIDRGNGALGTVKADFSNAEDDCVVTWAES